MTFDLSLEEGKLLVRLARNAVEEYLKTRKRIRPPEGLPQKLMQPCGVFVTINSVRGEEKELRGCIGLPYPTKPLAEAVIESAISSATQDPRFYPLSLEELDSVVFEVSVLTPPQLVEVKNPSEYPYKIKVGIDG
ncbi:MAG: TIGR00296 family protein, partial [Candidatus Bathyarchaeia archaeon]